jgi:hypothetical protein
VSLDELWHRVKRTISVGLIENSVEKSEMEIMTRPSETSLTDGISRKTASSCGIIGSKGSESRLKYFDYFVYIYQELVYYRFIIKKGIRYGI